ncbi:MAG: hypothetical protein Q8936_22450 [Bacillota bacterium]|nr:hypothetical protein [Bacillota bacterium]
MGNLYIGGSGSGSATLGIQQLSADGSVTTWGTLVEVTCLTSDVVVTLPSALAGSKGMNVVIKKLDNTNYKVIIKGNNTDTIESISQNIYLYGQNDAVTFANTINNSRIISDNRNSTGSTASFTRLTRTISQTGVVASTDVIFTDADTNIGSGVTFNSTTGIITLKANSTFKLSGSTGSAKLTGQSAYVGFMWKKSVDGGTTWSNIGTLGCCISPSGTTWDVYGDEQATASITTTTQTLVKLSITAVSGTNVIGTMNDVPALSSLPYCEIEEMSRQATVMNTVDTGYYKWSANQIISAVPLDLVPNTIVSGNIPLNTSTGVFSLVAGKTYSIELGLYGVWSSVGGITSGIICDASTNTQLTGSPLFALNTEDNGSNTASYSSSTQNKFIYTPSTNQTIKLRITNSNNNCSIQYDRSWVSITQIGSTACTNVPNTLIQPFTGATSSVNGTQGGVPIPSLGQQNAYLKGDGTWGIKIYKGSATIPDVGVLYSSLAVTGDIVSGSASANSGGSVEIIINHPVVSTNAIYNVTIENLGNQMYANDLTPLVFTRISTSQIKVYFEETATSTQNIKLNIMIFD